MIWQQLTVADAMSPGLTPGMITMSLIGFVGVLTLLAVADYALIARTIRRGPGELALGEHPAPADAPALSL